MQKTLITIACALLSASQAVNAQTKDTLRTISLDMVEVVSPIKEHGALREQPASVSTLSEKQLDASHVTSLKGISSIVPNLFIPEYGSRLTSAVYIRGIGSRLNTSAVGMYVDNMPFADKSAFDFSFNDVERVEVMRGPQGTLYGRNAMGGIVKVITRNPLYYQGVTLNAGFSTKDSRRHIALTKYHRPSRSFAFSAGAYYEGSNGMFRNAVTGKKVDALEGAGGKLRAIWLPTSRLNFDLQVGYDYSDEGAYPYYYTGALNKEAEQYQESIGKITNNHDNRYRRGMLNTGLNIGYLMKGLKLNSVTSFQNLNDRMFLDQDFLSDDIYTLEQKQRINTLSEEITLRTIGKKRWEWVSGINLMNQWMHTTGPVTFGKDGLTWLENTINMSMPDVNSIPSLKNMGFTGMAINFRGETLGVGGTFKTPTFNAAAFHQSTLHISDCFSATVGLRLDYEHNSINYNAVTPVEYGYKLTNPRIAMMNIDLQALSSTISYIGDMKHNYTKLLPKFALKYEFGQSNVYATVAEGSRSGGYNIQMFSDLIQGSMRGEMMNGVKEGVTEFLTELGKANPRMPVQTVINTMTASFPSFDSPSVDQIVYKPEYSWNYEVGTHLTSADKSIMVDGAVFYINTRDQQIARFAESGLGRMMVNAGKSESYGAEISATWAATKAFTIAGNYGYTHAEFTDYDAGNGSDYTGNYVPFIPQHTINLDAAYTFDLSKDGTFKSLTLGANYTGAGRIYWTESNSASQKFYSQLGARMGMDLSFATIQLWARNLTSTKFNTFYFESAGRGYEQHARPFQMGIDLKMNF